MKREDVYKIIDSERDYQESQWAGHNHEVGAYLTMLRYYLTDAERAWTKNNGDGPALDVIRKIGSIAVACMEEHGVEKRVINLNTIPVK